MLVSVLTGAAFAQAEAAVVADPLVIGYRGDPAKALGLPFEEVTVQTDLGPAPAWLIPGRPDATAAAIFVHGIGGLRENGYPFVRPLHAAGIPVLLMTYRKDAGAPEAALHAFGTAEWRDLEAAVAFMQDRGHPRLILVAASMGGAVVGEFLARSARTGQVAAVVLDAPALSFPMVMEHLLTGAGLPRPLARLSAPLSTRLFRLTHGLDLAGAETLPVLATLDAPLFLSHGTADRIVPVAISHRLLGERAGATTFVQSDGDHLQTRDRLPQVFDEALSRLAADVAVADARP